MVRKILCCFVILALLSFCVVPAFASSFGTGAYLLPGIEIDNIAFPNGSVIDWPNNFGTATQAFSVSTPYASFVCNRSASSLNTEVYFRNFSSFTIKLSDMFVNKDSRLILNDGGTGNIKFTRITFSGQYNLPRTDHTSNLYVIHSSNFSGGGSLDNVSEVDILDHLFYEINGQHRTPEFIYPMGCFWWQNVSVTIDFEVVDMQDDFFVNFDCSTSDMSQPFIRWFNGYDFVSGTKVYETVSFPGMFDWIVSSVNSFLTLEIAPGLTLNILFYVVIVLGLLVVFFKMFM
jgi:hypothetical protein